MIFLGLEGSFPRAANNYQLEVSLPYDKAFRWVDEIRRYLRAGHITAIRLERLIGKLGFSQTNLFGEFARTQLKPLYRKLYAARFIPQLSIIESRILHWWSRILLSLNPRIPRGISRIPDFIIYTGAATLSNKMAALAFSRKGDAPVISQLLVSNVPRFWKNHFHRKNIILGSEMLAPIAFLRSDPRLFRHKRANLYMDNDPSANALIRGGCGNPFLASTVCIFWKIVDAYPLDVWIGRVAPGANPSDLPTRGVKLTFEIKNIAQLKNLYKLLQETLIFLRS